MVLMHLDIGKGRLVRNCFLDPGGGLPVRIWPGTIQAPRSWVNDFPFSEERLMTESRANIDWLWCWAAGKRVCACVCVRVWLCAVGIWL